jgi:Fuc2NAc and GlcNAc transferase
MAEAEWLLVLVPGGCLVAGLGWLDDRWGLSPAWRLGGHVLAAAWLVWLSPPPPVLFFGSLELAWGWAGVVVAFLGVIWLINMYNFMDGIDGLSGGTAVVTALGGGLILLLSGRLTLFAPSLLLAASVLGFLFWNWPNPRAKIFMGDVGSGFLGYVFAAFWLVDGRESKIGLWLWPLLLGTFLVDATLTRLVLFYRERNFYRPHRTHAYQRLANEGNWGHSQTTITYLAIQGVWLGGWSLGLWFFPDAAGPMSLLALLPLVVGWLVVRRLYPADPRGGDQSE